MHAASSPGGLVVSNLMSCWVRDATEGGVIKSGPRLLRRSVPFHEPEDGHVGRPRPHPFLLSPELAFTIGGDVVHVRRRLHVNAGLQDQLNYLLPHLKYLLWDSRRRSLRTL